MPVLGSRICLRFGSPSSCAFRTHWQISFRPAKMSEILMQSWQSPRLQAGQVMSIRLGFWSCFAKVTHPLVEQCLQLCVAGVPLGIYRKWHRRKILVVGSADDADELLLGDLKGANEGLDALRATCVRASHVRTCADSHSSRRCLRDEAYGPPDSGRASYSECR